METTAGTRCVIDTTAIEHRSTLTWDFEVGLLVCYNRILERAFDAAADIRGWRSDRNLVSNAEVLQTDRVN